MGNLSSRVSDIVDDLKHSWYFRFWAVFWVVCCLTAFVGFIKYSTRGTEFGKEDGWRLWIKEEKVINLPKFQFRTQLDEPGNIMNYATCAWKDSLYVASAPCNDVESIQICVEFDPSTVDVTADSNYLNCVVNMTAPKNSDAFLAFKVAAGETFDPNDVWTWLQSSNGAYLSLTLRRLKSMHHSGFQDFWETSVSYRTSLVTKDLYVAVLQMDSFHVFYYEETDWYTGWMAAADTGGFAFFVVILHWIVMTFMNIFMENNSKFLGTGGAAQRATYNQL